MKRLMTKILVVALVFQMLGRIGIFEVDTAMAATEGIDEKSGLPYVNEIQVTERIKELAKLLEINEGNLNEGTGARFTVDGAACGHATSGTCSNCSNTSIVETKGKWFEKTFGYTVDVDYLPGQFFPNNVKGPRGYTCFGFANFALWYVAKVDSNSSVYKELVGVQGAAFSKANLEKYDVRIGDVIRIEKEVNGKEYIHSFMFLSFIDDKTIEVLDCNYVYQVAADISLTKIHPINIDDSYAMAITRASNYEPDYNITLPDALTSSSSNEAKGNILAYATALEGWNRNTFISAGCTDIPSGDWCAWFVTFCAKKVGIGDLFSAATGRANFCKYMINDYGAEAWYYSDSSFLTEDDKTVLSGATAVTKSTFTPQPGDIYILHEEGFDGISQIGFVIDVVDGYVHAVVGNNGTAEEVQIRASENWFYQISNSSCPIIGYIRPNYASLDEVPLTGISLSATSTTMNIGDTKTLKVTYTPSNTTDSKTVTWKSSNTSVATVSSSGVVTAVGNGTAKITATCGTKQATCTVTVDTATTGVSLNKTSSTLTSKGATVQLTATISPSNAANKNVTWKSSNTSVATVDENGLVTAVGNGTATITVTTESGSKTATCKVTVSIATTGVSLNKTSTTLTSEGETVQLTATVSPSNAANKNVTWKSSNTSVATVDSNGLVTAVGDGTATITVTTESGSKTATCTVTVDVTVPLAILSQPDSKTVDEGESVVFTVSAEGKNISYQWQFSKDGAYWSNSSMTGATTASMQVQALASRDGYQYRCVVTDAKGQKCVSEAATLTVNTMTITVQPESQNVTVNEYTTFDVKVDGTSLKYQWQFSKDGSYWSNSSMEGSTTASMKVQALGSRDGYQYRCVITDVNGKKITTEPATLTINPIVITAQPESLDVTINECANFTVKAEGTGLTYQWQCCKDGEYWFDSSMTGSNTASMQVQALTSRDGYQYRCVISDANGKKVTTEPATLSVKTIRITQQPESQTVLTNKYTGFTVEAEGSGLKYQWQFCRDGEYWSNSSMTGSTTSCMQVQALASRDGYQYRCVITDANDKQVITEPATLTVSTVVITSQPADKMVLTNKYTTFTVKAEGSGLTYQWQFCKDGKYWSNSSMEGSTTASMQVQGLTSRNGYQYRCVVTDANGNKVISEAANLTVGAIAITSQPESKTVSENGYTTFTVKAEGTGLKYQWQFCKDGEYWSNSSMAGSTTASMQVQALASRNGYRYRCIVTDANGNQVVSEVATLSVQ